MKRMLFVMLFCVGCTTKPIRPSLRLSKVDSQTISITGMDYAVLQQLSGDSASVWQNLIPVYKMPADTDMKDYQKPQPGKYIAAGKKLLFKADTPFTAHRLYFIRYYMPEIKSTGFDLLKPKRKPGSITYTDLTFKY